MRHVVERVEESCVDTLDARKPFDFNLSRISLEFLIYQNKIDVYHFSQKQFHNIL